MTVSKKIGLGLLWCAGLLTMLGCNLLFPLPEPIPTEEGHVLTTAVTTRQETATPTDRQTPLTILLRALVPTTRPADTATPTPQPTPPPPIARVNAALVNLRGGPGINYAIIGQVRTGDQITVVGRNEAGDWWRVCCSLGQTEESWVSAQFVDLQLPAGQTAAAIPRATIPAPPEPVVQAAGSGSSGSSASNVGSGAGAGLPGAGAFGAVGGTNPLTGLAGGRCPLRPLIVCISELPIAKAYGLPSR